MSESAEERLKSAEARAILQVRDAAWKIEMNAKRIETTRAARELAEQRLDAERKRYEVGMSTSFLVIQAQRDLAQTKNNELGAVLAYDLSLVDFDALQEAGPAGQSPAPASAAAAAGSIGAPTAVPRRYFGLANDVPTPRGSTEGHKVLQNCHLGEGRHGASWVAERRVLHLCNRNDAT